MTQFIKLAMAFLLPILVTGCITSQFPLLDNKTLVVDSSLTGHYSIPDPSNEKPNEYDVYLKGKEYLVVQDAKLAYIGTVHRWHEGTYLAQLRKPANLSDANHPPPSGYFYLLVRHTTVGVDLNAIQCETTANCEIHTLEDLNKLAAAAEQHPQAQQLATATKAAQQTPVATANVDSSLTEIDALRERLRKCWNPPRDIKRNANISVSLRVFFKKDGYLAQSPIVVASSSSPLVPTLAQSGRRALLRCQPYTMLKPEHYEQWKDITIQFNPHDLTGN